MRSHAEGASRMYYKLNLPGPAYFQRLRPLVGPVSYFLEWFYSKVLGVVRPLVYPYRAFPVLPPQLFARDIPVPIRKRVDDLLAEPGDRPLRLEFFYRVALEDIDRLSWGSVLLPADGLACVAVIYSADAWPDTTVSCFSRLQDGSLLITTDEPDHARWIGKYADVSVECLPYRWHYEEDIVNRHYSRLPSVQGETEEIAPWGLSEFLGDVVQIINDSWVRTRR